MTPLKAIRIFCLDCCNNQSKEVKLCAAELCPLLYLRFGKRIQGKSALRTIRLKCKDCGEGTVFDIKNCEFVECPLFIYRYGKNPALKGKRGNTKALLQYRQVKNNAVIRGNTAKKAIVEALAILFLTLALLPCTFASDYSSFTDEQIVAAIGKAENSVKFPYGIKSINTYSNKEYAYKICFNSVRNGRARWIKAGRPGDLVTFIGRRFSPPSVNPNWTRLVKYFLDNSKSNFTHIDVR